MGVAVFAEPGAAAASGAVGGQWHHVIECDVLLALPSDALALVTAFTPAPGYSAAAATNSGPPIVSNIPTGGGAGGNGRSEPALVAVPVPPTVASTIRGVVAASPVTSTVPHGNSSAGTGAGGVTASPSSPNAAAAAASASAKKASRRPLQRALSPLVPCASVELLIPPVHSVSLPHLASLRAFIAGPYAPRTAAAAAALAAAGFPMSSQSAQASETQALAQAQLPLVLKRVSNPRAATGAAVGGVRAPVYDVFGLARRDFVVPAMDRQDEPIVLQDDSNNTAHTSTADSSASSTAVATTAVAASTAAPAAAAAVDLRRLAPVLSLGALDDAVHAVLGQTAGIETRGLTRGGSVIFTSFSFNRSDSSMSALEQQMALALMLRAGRSSAIRAEGDTRRVVLGDAHAVVNVFSFDNATAARA